MTTELIKIGTDTAGRTAVSGRELHEFLEIATAYKDWFPRMVEYGFVEGIDFNLLKIERVQREGNRDVSRTVDDHAISLDMAKEISMIQRTPKGKEARQYFIECERKLKVAKPVLSGDELILAAITELQSRVSSLTQTVSTQQAKIETDKPKVLFSEAVATSKTEILVGELAKILHQNGVSVGQNRLFAKLRAEGYLCKTGSTRNMPTQRSMDLGLFRIKETTITHSDGHITISKTPKVTGKGQIYFVNKFIAWHQMYTEPLHPEAGGALTVHDELGNDVRIA